MSSGAAGDGRGPGTRAGGARSYHGHAPAGPRPGRRRRIAATGARVGTGPGTRPTVEGAGRRGSPATAPPTGHSATDPAAGIFPPRRSGARPAWHGPDGRRALSPARSSPFFRAPRIAVHACSRPGRRPTASVGRSAPPAVRGLDAGSTRRSNGRFSRLAHQRRVWDTPVRSVRSRSGTPNTSPTTWRSPPCSTATPTRRGSTSTLPGGRTARPTTSPTGWSSSRARPRTTRRSRTPSTRTTTASALTATDRLPARGPTRNQAWDAVATPRSTRGPRLDAAGAPRRTRPGRCSGRRGS